MGTEFILKPTGDQPMIWEYITGGPGEATALKELPEEWFLTFDEIVFDILHHRLTEQSAEDLRLCPKDELGSYHHSLGRWIRNSYGLWLEPNPLTEESKPEHVIDGVDHNPKHPDQISMDIIKEVYARLQWREFNAQILRRLEEHYKAKKGSDD